MKICILRIWIAVSLWLGLIHLHAQDIWRRPLTLSLFTVATQFPGGKITPVHPGMEIGTEFRYNKSEKNQWLQTVKTGIYYHKYSQTAIQLYTELDYRRKIWQKIKGDMKLGAGYLHAIPDLQSFVLEDGVYVKGNRFGRPQFMVSVALGVRYQFSALRDGAGFFMTIQCFLQMPFINSYVPVLPNTALHAGVTYPLFKAINNK